MPRSHRLIQATLILLLTQQAQSQVQSPNEQEKIRALSAALVPEIRRNTIPLNDHPTTDYLRTIITGLTRTSTELQEIPWNPVVVHDDSGGSTHEPFPLHDGHFFIPANLLLACTTEAELAAMLAHAMAHVMEPRIFLARENYPRSSSSPIGPQKTTTTEPSHPSPCFLNCAPANSTPTVWRPN